MSIDIKYILAFVGCLVLGVKVLFMDVGYFKNAGLIVELGFWKYVFSFTLFTCAIYILIAAKKVSKLTKYICMDCAIIKYLETGNDHKCDKCGKPMKICRYE